MTVSRPRRIIAAVFGGIATCIAIGLAAVSHNALVVTAWLLFGTATLTIAIRAVISLRNERRAAMYAADEAAGDDGTTEDEASEPAAG